MSARVGPRAVTFEGEKITPLSTQPKREGSPSNEAQVIFENNTAQLRASIATDGRSASFEARRSQHRRTIGGTLGPKTGVALVKRQERLLERLFRTCGFTSLEALRVAWDAQLASCPSVSGCREAAILREMTDAIRSNDLEVRIHVSSHRLKAVLKEGYRNASGGGAGGSQRNLTQRDISEANHLSLTPEEVRGLAPDERPKYGIACLAPRLVDAKLGRELVPPGYYQNDSFHVLADFFGDATIIVSAGELADQLCWTPGDSYARMKSHTTKTGWEDIEPHRPKAWDQMFVPWSARELMLPFLLASVPNRVGMVPSGRKSFSGPIEGPVQAFKDTWGFEAAEHNVPSYFEVQVFGELPPRKIKAVELRPEKPPSPELLQLFRECGIEARLTDTVNWPAHCVLAARLR
ncbi:MAG: hypothetical protein IT384_03480 [Deltaproteobacteria bacterium]|nr:hypothetical protein [Deltaproteobacteria bacterium]